MVCFREDPCCWIPENDVKGVNGINNWREIRVLPPLLHLALCAANNSTGEEGSHGRGTTVSLDR